MQTKRSYFFAGALGGGAENIKRTKKHLAHGTEKNQIPFVFVPCLGENQTSPMRFWKKGNKNPPDFFRRTLLCQVPGKNYAGEEMGAVPCAT